MESAREKLARLRQKGLEEKRSEGVSDNFTTQTIRNLEDAPDVKPEVLSDTPHPAPKLVRKEKQSKNRRIGAVVTSKARDNLERYVREGGYPSYNDFLNDLLENLDDILG